MARRRQQNVVSVLDSAEAYAKAVSESEKYLTVVDVHQGWTGPCTVIEPVFRKMFVDLDKADERLRIHTVDAALLSEEQRRNLPIHGCKPLFVVLKQKVVIAKIAGVNAPELEAAIVDNVPPVDSDE